MWASKARGSSRRDGRMAKHAINGWWRILSTKATRSNGNELWGELQSQDFVRSTRQTQRGAKYQKWNGWFESSVQVNTILLSPGSCGNWRILSSYYKRVWEVHEARTIITISTTHHETTPHLPALSHLSIPSQILVETSHPWNLPCIFPNSRTDQLSLIDQAI